MDTSGFGASRVRHHHPGILWFEQEIRLRTGSDVHVIVVTYTVDLAEIDAALGDHDDWLNRNYADGVLLASGGRRPRTGGVILAADIPRDELDRRLAEDPFVRRGLARHEVITVAVRKTAPGLEELMRPVDGDD